MSTILASRPRVKPTRKTTVLFDATERHPARRSFGSGILASRPVFRAPYTVADEAWAAEAFNAPTAYSRHVDFLAAEAAAYEAMECGLIAPDAADYISRTTLVGHPA